MGEQAQQEFAKKIVDRISFVVKKEEGEEEVKDHEVTKGPVVPPATKVSMETQTDFPEESKKPGSSDQKREEPTSSVGPQQREGTEEKKKKDTNADDTAPQKKPATLEYYGLWSRYFWA